MSTANYTVNFKAGELTQGEVKLYSWVGEKFGSQLGASVASAREYYGKVTPNSEGYHGVANHIGRLISEKISIKGMAAMAAGAAALPAMMALSIAGAAAAPIIAVGAAGAVIGTAGVLVSQFSHSIGAKLAKRRVSKALESSKPSTTPTSFKS